METKFDYAGKITKKDSAINKVKCNICGKEVSKEVYYESTFMDNNELLTKDILCENCYNEVREFILYGVDNSKNIIVEKVKEIKEN